MKKGLENFRDFDFIFPSFLPVSSISHPFHLLPHLLTPHQFRLGFLLLLSYNTPSSLFRYPVSLAMQRALSTRTSVLSAASKRAPFARSTLNLQQQRFAHKVRATFSVDAIDLRMDFPMTFGLDFRLFRSSPSLTLADRNIGAQVRCRSSCQHPQGC